MITTVLGAAALQTAIIAASAPMPDTQASTTMLEAADARLFYSAFEGCTPDTLDAIMHPHFRMIHDLDGLVADSREAFVEQIEHSCANRAPGGTAEGYKNRRLVVPGTRTFRRMGEWGMIENANHVFFELRLSDNRESRDWVMVGGASYTHMWQWMPQEQRFRLLESISYDHGAALPYPPQ